MTRTNVKTNEKETKMVFCNFGFGFDEVKAKIDIPVDWLNEMQVDNNDNLKLVFEENKIVIEKSN